jgi:hypothetical protein
VKEFEKAAATFALAYQIKRLTEQKIGEDSEDSPPASRQAFRVCPQFSEGNLHKRGLLLLHVIQKRCCARIQTRLFPDNRYRKSIGKARGFQVKNEAQDRRYRRLFALKSSNTMV